MEEKSYSSDIYPANIVIHIRENLTNHVHRNEDHIERILQDGLGIEGSEAAELALSLVEQVELLFGEQVLIRYVVGA